MGQAAGPNALSSPTVRPRWAAATASASRSGRNPESDSQSWHTATALRDSNNNIIGVLVNLFLMAGLGLENWLRLFIWMAIGLLIYFTYSRHHSHLVTNPVVPEANRRVIEKA